MLWFLPVGKALAVDLQAPGNIALNAEQDLLCSDPRRYEFDHHTNWKKVKGRLPPMSAPQIQDSPSRKSEDLDKMLSKIRALVLKKSQDYDIDHFMESLRLCAEGNIAETKSAVEKLLHDHDFAQEDAASLEATIALELLDYQANHIGELAAQPLEKSPVGQGKGAKQETGRRPPRSVVGSPTPGVAQSISSVSTRSRTRPSIAKLTVEEEDCKYHLGSFRYFFSEAALAVNQPSFVGKAGDVYVHKNTDVDVDATQVWVAGASGDWLDVTERLADKEEPVSHPIHQNKFLLFKATGKPNWVDRAYLARTLVAGRAQI